MALHPFDPPIWRPRPAPAGAATPALAYLAGLAPTTRRVMRSDLDTIARLLTGGRYDAASLGAGWLAVNRLGRRRRPRAAPGTLQTRHRQPHAERTEG